MYRPQISFRNTLFYVPFLILPLIFLVLGLFLKNEINFYHLYVTDPEYAYLLDSLGIAYFKIPNQVIGPGTPPQLFAAMVMEIVHLFRHHGTLAEDVLANPDLYLDAIQKSLTIFITILIFVVGAVSGSISKNIFNGIFLQLIPFSSWQTLDLLRRYTVENMVIAGMILMIIVLFIYINNQSENEKRNRQFAFLFALIIGFIAATKLMYLSVAIIPFLVLPGVRNKIIYTVISILAFSIFAFTVFSKWSIFWDWHVQNFIHSGQYGAGAKTIIQWPSFVNNFKTLVSIDGTFELTFYILIVGVLLYHIPFLHVQRKNDKKYLALLGIVISMIFMTFLVCKQLKYYYMITTILLEIPGLFLLSDIFTRPFNKKIKFLLLIIPALFIIKKCLNETMIVYNAHLQNIQRRENYMQAYKFANTTLKGRTTLLIPDYYGAPYKEYGIYFGTCWAGPSIAEKFSPILDSIYPNVYIHHGWNNLFNQWDKSYSFIDAMRTFKKVIVCIGDENLARSLNPKLHGLNREIDTHWKLLKSFPLAKTNFYEMQFDSSAYVNPMQITFDAERVDSTGNFNLSTNGLEASNGSTRSSDAAHSGTFSSKLTPEDPYGFTCYLSEVRKDEHYVFSVWRKTGNDKAGLVISSSDPGKYYYFCNKIVKQEGDWQQIEYDWIVPVQAHNMDMKIYVWNPDNTNPAYMDDFSIERK